MTLVNFLNLQNMIMPFCQVLHHIIQNPSRVFLELNRVLRIGGVLIFSVSSATSLRKRINLLLGKNIYDGYSLENRYGRRHREFTLSEVSLLLSSFGFTPFLIRTWSPPITTRNPFLKAVNIAQRSLWRWLDIGDLVFACARKGSTPDESNISWLYRPSPGHKSMFK